MTSHIILEAELVGFVGRVNEVLRGNTHLANIIPIEPPEKLFEHVQDGILLSELINYTVVNTIPKTNYEIKTPHHAIENHNRCISAAKTIGCHISNIGPMDLMKTLENNTEHLVLGMLWQIIKVGLMSKLNIKMHPELIRLVQPGEDLVSFLELPPEKMLLRWVNYHMKHSSHPRTVANFTDDIKDSIVYALLLNQIAPDKCQIDVDQLMEMDLIDRAEKVLQEAEKIDCRKFVTAADIVNGQSKLNLAFVATLFNTCPGIQLPSEDELKLLNQSKEELYATVQKLMRQEEAATSKMSELETKVEALTSAMEATQQEKDLYAELNVALQDQVDDLKSCFDSAQKELKETNDGSKTELEGLMARIAALEEEIRILKEENAQLKSDWASKVADLQQKLDKERLDNGTLITNTKKLSQGLSEARVQIAELQEQLAAMDEARSEAEAQATAFGKANERGMTAFNDLQETNNLAKEEINKLQTEISTKKTELYELKELHLQEVGELTRALSERKAKTDDWKKKYKTLQDDYDDLGKKYDRSQVMFTHYANQVARSRMQIVHLRRLYNTFSSAKKLARAVIEDYDREALEKRTDYEKPLLMGVLIRPPQDKHKEEKPFFYILKDNFLLIYKVESQGEPHHVLRIDDCDLEKVHEFNNYKLSITTVHCEQMVYQIQFESDTELNAWFEAMMLGSEWWADNKARRQRNMTVVGKGSSQLLLPETHHDVHHRESVDDASKQ